MQITNKDQMYEFYRRGALGNCFRIWNTREEILASDFDGKLSLRTTKRGGPGVVGLDIDTALDIGENYKRQGYKVVYCESAPDYLRLLQGELVSLPHGIELTYSRKKAHMREALKEPLFSSGRRAEYLVRSSVSEADWEDIQALFERYPEHVIEFTTYMCFVGQLKGRRTVIWEVRYY